MSLFHRHLGVLAGNHRLVYSGNSIWSQVGLGLLSWCHTPRRYPSGGCFIGWPSSEHRQGGQGDVSSGYLVYTCSLSTLSTKLLRHLSRNWNSSKISMYIGEQRFYRNQRLKWTIKVSCPPLSAWYLPLKNFDSSFLNNSSNEFSITGLPRRDHSNRAHSLGVPKIHP